MLAIQHSNSLTLDVISQVVSQFIGSGLIWLLVIGALFLERRRLLHQAGVTLAIGLILEVLVVEVLIKPLIARPRPFWVIENLPVIDPMYGNYSFPSGHVTSITLAAWILTYFFPKTWWFWTILIVLTGWSRIYNGVHWPSDVIGGILIGGFVGWLTLRIIPICFSKLKALS